MKLLVGFSIGLLIAQIDFAGIVSVLTAIGVLASIVFQMYEKIKSQQRHDAEAKIAQDRHDAQEAKLTAVADDVHKVEVATNSMKDALVTVTEKEALARGGIEKRERAAKEKSEMEKRLMDATQAEALSRGGVEERARADAEAKNEPAAKPDEVTDVNLAAVDPTVAKQIAGVKPKES